MRFGQVYVSQKGPSPYAADLGMRALKLRRRPLVAKHWNGLPDSMFKPEVLKGGASRPSVDADKVSRPSRPIDAAAFAVDAVEPTDKENDPVPLVAAGFIDKPEGDDAGPRDAPLPKLHGAAARTKNDDEAKLDELKPEDGAGQTSTEQPAEPATAEPATAKPATAEPATAGPATAGPAAAAGWTGSTSGC